MYIYIEREREKKNRDIKGGGEMVKEIDDLRETEREKYITLTLVLMGRGRGGLNLFIPFLFVTTIEKVLRLRTVLIFLKK